VEARVNRTNQTWGVIYEDYYSHALVYVLVRAASKKAAEIRACNFDPQTTHAVSAAIRSSGDG
jgi:hypothetical protein